MATPNFNLLFRETKGKPVMYAGRHLVLSDRVPAKLGQRFNITIESTSSKYAQGVGISEGVTVFGELVKRAVVWEYFSVEPSKRQFSGSILPFEFQVECRNKSGFLSFYNMAEFQGRQEWWSAGSCMWVEQLTNGRRYHCNDFELDDDFDDIIFTVIPT